MQKTSDRIAFISGNGFSETFTKAHIDDILPVFRLTGGTPPRMLNDKPIVQLGLIKRIRNKLVPIQKLGDPYFPFEFFLNKYNPNVVVAEYGTAGAEVNELCKKYNVPLIVNFYGYDAFRFETLRKYETKYKAMFDYASTIFTQSNSIARKLESMGCKPAKLNVNPYPSSPLFENCQADHLSSRFVAVGRFVDKKSPLTTIQAFAKVVSVHSEARLVFAGDGPLFEEAVAFANSLGIATNVDFVGRITQQQQMELFKTSFCFLQHSVVAADGDQEGLPVSIMEALTSAMPVVSTLHSGIPEVVLDGKNGFLVNENDVEGMFRAMKALYEDRNLVRQMGEFAKQEITGKFTRKRHIEKMTIAIKEAKR